jgi:psp operon transcriptional activator
VLFLPPLRERREDILLLANHFAGRMAVELGWDEIPHFSPEAADALERYPWPGNVRELKNVVERAVYRSEALLISSIDFDPFYSPFEDPIDQPQKQVLKSEQKPDQLDHLMHQPENALRESKYNQRKAAERLGMTYHQFRGLYRQYQKTGSGNNLDT